MSGLPHADNRRRKPESPGEVRLSPAQSAIVIAGLSALSWAILILIVVALLPLL
jgi:hypothetical protein